MSKAFSNLIKKGKKKAGGKGQEAGASATKPSAAQPPPKSLDDQTYNKWVQDHQQEEEGEDFLEEEGQEALVLYSYKPTGLEDEIPLEKDEIILVFEQHSSGWWTGQSKGGYGLFPGSYVRMMSAPPGAVSGSPPSLPTGAAPSLPSEKPAADPATAFSSNSRDKISSSADPHQHSSPADAVKPSSSAHNIPGASNPSPSPAASRSASTLSQTAAESSAEPKLSTHAQNALAISAVQLEDSSSSAFLKTVVAQLQSRIELLVTRVQELENGAPGATPDAAALRAENARLQKTIEDMKIEKELADWNHEKRVTELQKEVGRLSEPQQGDSVWKAKLVEAQNGADQERSIHEQALKKLLENQANLQKELEVLRSAQGSLSGPASSAPPDMMEQLKQFMQQQQSMLQSQMQSELATLKSQVAREHASESALESQLADLKRQLEREQKERAKLRADLINSMSSSQINSLKQEVLDRSEVREGKLWDPINNVFLAADGKWLRPTGKDLSH